MDGNDKGELLYRRRSSRMVLRVPLLINAVDSSGEASWEQVETVVVSLHGGMVRTHQTYPVGVTLRSEEHTSELQSRLHLVCRLLLEKKKNRYTADNSTENYR